MRRILPLLASALVMAAPAMAQNAIDNTMGSGNGNLNAVAFGGSSRATSGCDDFNRASGTAMGADWTEMQGDFGITNNTGYHISTGHAWMQHNSVADNYATSVSEIDFLAKTGGSNLIYVALIAGRGTDDIFVKVQDNNSDGLYDRVFFYHGISAGNWGTNSGSYYFDLAVPTVSGHMRLSFANGGDTAVLDIDRNFDGVYDETFQSSGLLTSPYYSQFGTGFGVGAYNSPAFDNWEVNGGCGGPPPFSLAKSGSCPGVMNFTATGATPGGNVAFTWGMGASWNIPAGYPCSGTTLPLTPLFTPPPGYAIVAANGAGTAAFGGNVPASACGVVKVVAVDLSTCSVSNTVTL